VEEARLTGFIDGLRDRGVVVLHGVLGQLQGVQPAHRLVPSGPVEGQVVDVVAP
jgi:hypothetical protein